MLKTFYFYGKKIISSNSFYNKEMFNLYSSPIFFSIQAEDLLDDILSIESSSLADSLKLDPSYSSDLSIKQEPSAISDAEIHAIAKDRQKKDNHNMSE